MHARRRLERTLARATNGVGRVIERIRRAGRAAALLATIALLLCAAAVQAQTSVILVKNTAQANGGNLSLRTWDQAQSFMTGTNSTGYLLTSVDVVIADVAGTGDPSDDLVVTIHSSDADGSLGTSLYTLNKPARIDPGTATFTAPGDGVLLQTSTEYFIVFDVSGNGINARIQKTVDKEGAEDAGKAAGWSIHDESRIRSRISTRSLWFKQPDAFKLAIKGHARGSATLSSLALADASNDSTVALSPGFAAATYDYTASVGKAVTRVTVTARASDNNASLTLAVAVMHGQEVTVSYTVPGATGAAPIQDVARPHQSLVRWSTVIDLLLWMPSLRHLESSHGHRPTASLLTPSSACPAQQFVKQNDQSQMG